MIVFVTNIPTPYRMVFFNELNKKLKLINLDMSVIYCCEKEPMRHWDISLSDFRHSYSILSKNAFSIPKNSFIKKGLSIHCNFNIYSELLALKPKVVIYAGAWWMPSNFIARIAAKKIGAKNLFWSEGHSAAVWSHNKLLKVFKRLVLGSYQGFVVPNRLSGEYLKSLVERTIDTIYLPNLVDDDYYSPLELHEKQELRKELGLDKEKVFVQVSMLEPWKGVIELAESFVSLQTNLASKSLLVFIGTGSLYEELKAIESKSSGAIKVLGHLDQDKVRTWLRASDWFVLNTKLDPNPLTPIEAGLCGLPLLISGKSGNVAEVCSTENGIVINDPSECKRELLQALLCDDLTQRKLSQASYDLISKKFSTDAVIKNFVEKVSIFLRQ